MGRCMTVEAMRLRHMVLVALGDERDSAQTAIPDAGVMGAEVAEVRRGVQP